MPDLTSIYRAYIACLNARDWSGVGRFVHPQVVHNGRALGLAGYVEMLQGDVRDIPDLRFELELLAVDGSMAASRLAFDCTPKGLLLGLPVNGRRITFREHAFYAFEAGLISQVWSILDKAAIEAQL